MKFKNMLIITQFLLATTAQSKELFSLWKVKNHQGVLELTACDAKNEECFMKIVDPVHGRCSLKMSFVADNFSKKYFDCDDGKISVLTGTYTLKNNNLKLCYESIDGTKVNFCIDYE